jgi:parallel beta-helix repeat protein
MKARIWRRAGWLVALPALAAALVVWPAGAGADGGIACGATITVDTTLTKNVVRCPGDGLVVAGDGVTLDLGGHTVSGLGAGSGIVLTGVNATLTNGVVTRFQQGVDVERDASQATLSGLTVKKNGTGLLVGPNPTGPAFGTVSGSAFSSNDLDGVFLNGGFWTVEDTTIAHNGRDGVHGYPDADRQTIVGNRITYNAGRGISFTNQNDGLTIADNVASRNGGDGIHVDDSTAHITGNTAHANGGSGIWVNEDSGLAFGPSYLIAGNTSTANLGFGIRACMFVDPQHTCEPGMIDGGGNVAKSNQQTPECVNVVCARRR